MSDKRFTTNGYYINDTYRDGRKWLFNEVEAEEIINVMNGLDTKARESRKAISKLQKENEQLHHELQQIKEYLQIKIDECKNHKKMKEIVFGVEQAVGYEKALLQFQKGLKRRLNDE